jgi:ribonucleotide monophosphatase NagD (HAD superfamily)
MIGDNPKSDIRGGNAVGWETIMVRTGVFCGEINDEEDPAKYVVHDFTDAIKLIFKLEGINHEIK